MGYLRLDEVCNLNMGQSPSSDSYNQEGKGIPFFQGNADFGEMYPITRVWCDEPTKIVEKGTLLISVRAPIGALNFATEKSCIGRGLAGLTVKVGYDLKYIYYVLRYKEQELNNKGTGSTFRAILKSSLGEVLIPDMSIEKQRDCVKKLDLIQRTLVDKKKQLEQLDTLIKARFVEMFGDIETNPFGWRKSTIGQECFYIKDGPHKSPKYIDDSSGIPFISTRNVVSGSGIDWSTAKYITEEDYVQCIKKCHPEKGDILYSKGGTTGVAKLVDTDRRFANWVHVAVLKFGGQLNGRFFECMLNSDYCYAQSQALTKGIANRDFVLSAIAQVVIFVPPIKLQRHYADFIHQVNKSKSVVLLAVKLSQLLCGIYDKITKLTINKANYQTYGV